MTRIFVDFEMNRTSREARERTGLWQEIIQIGAVRMDDNYNVVDTFRTYIRPEYNDAISSQIYHLTGITGRDVADQPLLAEGLRAFDEWCGPDFVRMYEWSDSDWGQLDHECEVKGLDSPLLYTDRAWWVDFQRVYCRIMRERRQVSLEYALQCCGIEPEGVLHDGADDARNSARLMAYIHSPAFRKHRSALDAVHKKAPSSMNGLSGALQSKLAALLEEMNGED